VASALDLVNQEALAQAAERARVAYDVTLPNLRYWNAQPCSVHAELGQPQQDCRRCGVLVLRHQRVAVSWMYLIRTGLLADQVGLGKTVMVNGLLAMLYQAGEMDSRRGGGRALIVCRPAALDQWQDQLRRMVPALPSVIVTGTQRERSDAWANPWDVAFVGHQAYLRDVEQVTGMGIHHLIVDDVDPIRDTDNKTAWAVKRMATRIPRTILTTASPLQKNLEELYAVFDCLGKARQLFGDINTFRRRYMRREKVTFYTPGGKKRTKMKTVGYRNIDEFKTKIAPFSLRRGPDDVEGLDLPAVMPNPVYLDLHPAQRERYDELARGVLQMTRGGLTTVKRVAASAKMVAAAHICESLAILDGVDTPQSSVKFDWIVNQLLGDWSGENEDSEPEKAVTFIHYKLGLEALSARLDAHGIGNVRVWGNERDPKVRREAKERFWDDPTCRVLLGTSAIEQSLDLQCARHEINVDRLPNPQRMTQLAGRIRRGGSKYKTVFVHNLIAVDTHEQRIVLSNETEAALSTAVWDETDPLHAPLSPVQMLQLIAPSVGRRVA
jgi:SNF2 family DNA or RNA helicase